MLSTLVFCSRVWVCQPSVRSVTNALCHKLRGLILYKQRIGMKSDLIETPRNWVQQ